MEQLGDNFGTTLGDVLETTLALLKKYLWTNGESTPSTVPHGKHWTSWGQFWAYLGLFVGYLGITFELLGDYLGRCSNNQNGNLRWYLPLGVVLTVRE